MNIANIVRLVNAGNVKRCHTHRIHGEYSVASHCYQMLNLLFQLYPGIPSTKLIKAITYHDSHEYITGDVPAPIKWGSPELRAALDGIAKVFDEEHGLVVELTEVETEWLHALDMLEFAIWCSNQALMGNQTFDDIGNYAMQMLEERPQLPKEIDQFLDELEENNHEA